MPELPEVEVSRMGIAPHLESQCIQKIVVRQPQLRWPIPKDVLLAEGSVIHRIRRRAKYLLLETDVGSIVLHLGMSGNLRVVSAETAVQKHDHLDIQLTNGQCLRLNDPRRFGACLWQGKNDKPLALFNALGPEPLTDAFDSERLYNLSRTKTQAVKNFVMDNKVVVGVGNIYANEALFQAGIDPRKPAKKVTKKAYILLTDCIKKVLAKAITQGGTTLKDFAQVDGKPGYFAQELLVYGRAGKPCVTCGESISSETIGQRNSFFCTTCQK